MAVGATESSMPQTASSATEGVVVRQARPADAVALHELAAATFPLACPPTTTDAAKAAFIAEH